MFARFSNYITGGLLIALALVSLGWYIDNTKLAACKSAREADKALYKKAQSDALAEHLKALRDKEKEYEAKAQKADEAYGALVGKHNDALRLYVKSQSTASGTAPAPDGGSAEGDNRPRENPFISETDIAHPELDITQVVVVPVSDLAICTENTARLVIARDWALGLNE